MSTSAAPRRTVVADAVYGLLDPIPFGFFVAALIFDILYARTAELLWGKGAAWLITFGLLFAVVPRLLNLAQVWITSRRTALRTDKLDFWLNLLAIVAAIFNAFVHSRDAYAVVPTGVWLSACTVILLSIGHIMMAVHSSAAKEFSHE
jgi:Predicted membrane protein